MLTKPMYEYMLHTLVWLTVAEYLGEDSKEIETEDDKQELLWNALSKDELKAINDLAKEYNPI
jgi:hypothetical protein